VLFSLTIYWLRSLRPKSRRPNVQVRLVRDLRYILHSAPVGLNLQYFDHARSLVPTPESLGCSWIKSLFQCSVCYSREIPTRFSKSIDGQHVSAPSHREVGRRLETRLLDPFLARHMGATCVFGGLPRLVIRCRESATRPKAEVLHSSFNMGGKSNSTGPVLRSNLPNTDLLRSRNVYFWKVASRSGTTVP
jgi:hypothetical protein